MKRIMLIVILSVIMLPLASGKLVVQNGRIVSIASSGQQAQGNASIACTTYDGGSFKVEALMSGGYTEPQEVSFTAIETACKSAAFVPVASFINSSNTPPEVFGLAKLDCAKRDQNQELDVVEPYSSDYGTIVYYTKKECKKNTGLNPGGVTTGCQSDSKSLVCLGSGSVVELEQKTESLGVVAADKQLAPVAVTKADTNTSGVSLQNSALNMVSDHATGDYGSSAFQINGSSMSNIGSVNMVGEKAGMAAGATSAVMH